MRTIKLLTATLILLLISGCSFVEDVNETFDYVQETTDYIEELSSFATEAPQLIQQASEDPEVRAELEAQLESLKTDVESFIETNDVPALAEGVHEELVNKNEVLLEEINRVLEDGQVALDKLEDSGIMTTIDHVTDLLDRIENLGQ